MKKASTPGVEDRARRMELLLSILLRTGVITSLLVVSLGVVLQFMDHPGSLSAPGALQHFIGPEAGFPHTWQQVLTGLLRLDGQALIMAGLLLLIATPILRVFISIFVFIQQKDAVYTLITLLVFLLLLLSFVLGEAE